MNKKIIIYTSIVILMLLLFIPNKIYASTNEYIIKSYNITMVVNEDNTFDITENITAYFNVPKHGIYRKIPLKNTITRIDGTTSKNTAKVTNIDVSEQYSTNNEDGYKVIKIGSSSETFTGIHSYTIKYNYDIGKDPLKEIDELYFNLIGDKWETSISNIKFTIKMPKEFDESLLGFSCGTKGTTNSSIVSYNVTDKTITGTVNKTLNSGEALTVRLELPEGYFIKKKINLADNWYSILVMVLCVVFVLIADKLWNKYGKDNEVVETVEFYPPEGYNSAEIGYFYKGKADNQGVISLLIYLANKGYLKIDEFEKKELFGKRKSFKIIKLKEYDGDNEIERIFFNGLFNKSNSVNYKKVQEIIREAKKNGEELSFFEAEEIASQLPDGTNKVSVKESDLQYRFYIVLDKIKEKLNNKKNKEEIFEKNTKKAKIWLIIMMVVILFLITYKPVVEYSGVSDAISSLFFPGFGYFILLAIMSAKNPTKTRIASLMLLSPFILSPIFMLVFPALIDNSMYLVTYISGILCIVVLSIFLKIMDKRTKFGNEILGKIRGFKRFLETAEKEQLEDLVNENPEYFYNILPYTYALGVSKVWMKQFETIAIQPPDWYDYSGNFVIYDFNNFVNNTMQSANRAMTSMPSEGSGSSGGSSGRGSSGGGFSGGGSGGGGGGSW